MRPIKFRAWNFLMKVMSFSSEWKLDGQDHNTVEEFFISEDGTVVFMQFTGLHDKNGKEIYEGDIVRYDDGDGWETGREAVKFENGAFNCSCYHPEMELFIEESRIIEVIGNIYENKELLEETP